MFVMAFAMASEVTSTLSAGTVVTPKHSRDPALVGRVVREPIYTGETVRPERLAPAGTVPGIPGLLGAQEASFRILLRPKGALVAPGDRVDVFDRAALCVLVSDVRALAVSSPRGLHFAGETLVAARDLHVAVPAVQIPFLEDRPVGILVRHPADRRPSRLPACPAR